MKEKVINAISPLLNDVADRIVQFQHTLEGCQLTLEIGDINPDQRKNLNEQIQSILASTFSDISIKVTYSAKKQTPHSHQEPSRQKQSPHAGVPTPQPIPGIKHVIAIASGKGGVGKSAVSALLTYAFKELGLKVALLDADIYGPSQAQIFGIDEKPKANAETGKILPIFSHQIPVMSFSFFAERGEPVIWRGPILMKVLQQFFFDVAWGEQDLLIIDLPPGTGDVQLTMAQSIHLSGALLVTTPQELSVLDAIKGGNMFNKLNIPLFGIVENMSKFVCTNCNSQHMLFRHGGGQSVAETIGTDLLASLPLVPNLCDYLDIGRLDEAYQIPQVATEMKQLAINIAKCLEIPTQPVDGRR